MSRYFLVILVVISISACGSDPTAQFCFQNGYQEGSPGFEQCRYRYNSQKKYYSYCSRNQGLILENSNDFQQCLAEAPHAIAHLEEERRVRAEERRIEQQMRAEAERQERIRREAERKQYVGSLYANAHPGDMLNCTVSGGFFDYNKWREYSPVSFIILRGEYDKEVTFISTYKNNKETLRVSFSDEGEDMEFCPYNGRCGGVYGIRSKYGNRPEFTASLEINKKLKHAKLHCKKLN